jgi:histidinol-phosphatase (PHP family)
MTAGGMTMICDLHVHTKHSYDGEEEMAALCERALVIGLTHICFTDHIDMNPQDSGCGIYDFESYFKEFDRVREKYVDKLTVLSGLEFAEPHLYCDLFEKIKRYPFDYTLGSMHWTRGNYPKTYESSGWTLEQAYGYYWEEMEKMVEYGGFDAISHFDLPKRYLRHIVFEPGQILRIFRKAVDNGIVMEINTSSLRAGASECMPGKELLELYRQAGGSVVTTGSDAHTIRDLGAGILEARTMLKAAGLSSGYFKERILFREIL